MREIKGYKLLGLIALANSQVMSITAGGREVHILSSEDVKHICSSNKDSGNAELITNGSINKHILVIYHAQIL